ncbi:exported protein of unknown function (plasmid) [Streptantibioticus cattleyicolor NRRL 8057 = DSM 46488]|nr:exported protein of unknown function [Streptantibioticus cattleyicolor NRRL 8057 = DSM 46488]
MRRPAPPGHPGPPAALLLTSVPPARVPAAPPVRLRLTGVPRRTAAGRARSARWPPHSSRVARWRGPGDGRPPRDAAPRPPPPSPRAEPHGVPPPDRTARGHAHRITSRRTGWDGWRGGMDVDMEHGLVPGPLPLAHGPPGRRGATRW